MVLGAAGHRQLLALEFLNVVAFGISPHEDVGFELDVGSVGDGKRGQSFGFLAEPGEFDTGNNTQVGFAFLQIFGKGLWAFKAEGRANAAHHGKHFGERLYLNHGCGRSCLPADHRIGDGDTDSLGDLGVLPANRVGDQDGGWPTSRNRKLRRCWHHGGRFGSGGLGQVSQVRELRHERGKMKELYHRMGVKLDDSLQLLARFQVPCPSYKCQTPLLGFFGMKHSHRWPAVARCR